MPVTLLLPSATRRGIVRSGGGDGGGRRPRRSRASLAQPLRVTGAACSPRSAAAGGPCSSSACCSPAWPPCRCGPGARSSAPRASPTSPPTCCTTPTCARSCRSRSSPCSRTRSRRPQAVASARPVIEQAVAAIVATNAFQGVFHAGVDGAARPHRVGAAASRLIVHVDDAPAMVKAGLQQVNPDVAGKHPRRGDPGGGRPQPEHAGRHRDPGRRGLRLDRLAARAARPRLLRRGVVVGARDRRRAVEAVGWGLIVLGLLQSRRAPRRRRHRVPHGRQRAGGPRPAGDVLERHQPAEHPGDPDHHERCRAGRRRRPTPARASCRYGRRPPTTASGGGSRSPAGRARRSLVLIGVAVAGHGVAGSHRGGGRAGARLHRLRGRCRRPARPRRARRWATTGPLAARLPIRRVALASVGGIVAVCAVLFFGGLAFLRERAGAAGQAPPDCRGRAATSIRSCATSTLDHVVFAGTHNSMSAQSRARLVLRPPERRHHRPALEGRPGVPASTCTTAAQIQGTVRTDLAGRG